MARVCERIYHFDYGSIVVRVWAHSNNLMEAGERTHQRHAVYHVLRNAMTGEDFAVGMAEAIAKLDFVNAVEVRWKDGGDGVLIYPDWP